MVILEFLKQLISTSTTRYNNFKFCHAQCLNFGVDLGEDDGIVWERDLLVDTICQLIESGINWDDLKDIPNFYKLYCLLKKIEKQENIDDDNIYKIPEGITDFGNARYSDVAILKQIKVEAKGKIVIFPKSLSRLDESLFKPNTIEGVYLNEGLKSLGPHVFKNQYLYEITLPSSLERVTDSSFNYEFAQVLKFSDFKNSKLLCDLLWIEEPWANEVIRSIFYREGIKEIVLYDELNNKYIIDCKDLKFKANIETMRLFPFFVNGDSLTVREKLHELIKEKTGYDVPTREMLGKRNFAKTLMK